MSDEKNNGNYYLIGGAVAVIAVLLGFFTMSGFDTGPDVVVNTEASGEANAEEIIVVAEKIKKLEEETADEIIKNAKDEAMATKANEAAIQMQVNEAVKNTENEE
jgi:cytochrome c biogenesis protein ResB